MGLKSEIQFEHFISMLLVQKGFSHKENDSYKQEHEALKRSILSLTQLGIVHSLPYQKQLQYVALLTEGKVREAASYAQQHISDLDELMHAIVLDFKDLYLNKDI